MTFGVLRSCSAFTVNFLENTTFLCCVARERKKGMAWEGTTKEKGGKTDDEWKAASSPLGTDLKILVNNEKFSDVSFLVGEEKVKMFALKGILSARSKVFCRMFEGKPAPLFFFTR